ncbi:MAG: hypothetical protein M3154_03140 [Candidatus Eremiobacteraeota bacterium]|nr:hypothetical protein [Candidatus Eremiobacteraeota bacterium]
MTARLVPLNGAAANLSAAVRATGLGIARALTAASPIPVSFFAGGRMDTIPRAGMLIPL